MTSNKSLPSLEKNLEAALRYLTDAQHKRGWVELWHEEASDEWSPAFVGRLLSSCPALPGDKSMVERCARQVAAKVRADGWGFSTLSPADCDSTATALLFLSEHNSRGELPWHLLEGWHDRSTSLYRTYSPDDPFGAEFEGFSHPMSCVSATVAECLARSGDAERGKRLLDLFVADYPALPSSVWWESGVYVTFCLVSAMRSLHYWPTSLCNELRHQLTSSQQQAGSWRHADLLVGSPFLTGLAAWSAYQLNAPESADLGVRWLLANQEVSGRWSPLPVLYFPPRRGQPVTSAHLLADRYGLFATSAAILALTEARARGRELHPQPVAAPEVHSTPVASRFRGDGFGVVQLEGGRPLITTFDAAFLLGKSTSPPLWGRAPLGRDTLAALQQPLSSQAVPGRPWSPQS